ncbi:MAG: TolC family protein [Acidobacteria bacterium]|nr:TolC family protein [Acidobacteriota bacterium]
MSSFRFQFIVGFVSLIAPLVAIADTLADQAARAALRDSQLEALVDEALANAPEIATARASVDAAEFRIIPAGTLADPFLSTTYQNDGRSISFGDAEGSFLGLMGSQALPWPGKLRLASDAAASEAKEVERGALGRAALTIEARVRNAWYDLVLARAIDAIIDERRTATAQIEASVRERYAAGLAEQQDVLRAQVELIRIDELKTTQAATIASRLAELNRLVGTPQDRPVETPDRLPDDATIAALADLIAASMARSPELASSEQAIETSRIRVEEAKKNFYPDFTVNAGYMNRGGWEMGPMWQVGVGVNVPIWIDRKQRNQVAEAEAIGRGRSSERDVVMRELELRTRERSIQLDAALRVAALYRDKVLPLDVISLESALASYQSGKLPFITVLDALNTLYADRSALESRFAESAKWRVAIDEASLQPTAMAGAPSMGTSGMAGSVGAGFTQSSAANSNATSGSSMSSMR